MAVQTPEEYIQYYSEKLMEKFNNRGIQINKVGVIGFFMNLLGWTRFDVENYYDSLFKETSIYTAQTYENIIFRGSIYGYNPTFAQPSTAVGTINFDFDTIATVPNAVKYEVLFNCPTPILYYENNVQTSLQSSSILCTTEIDDIKFSSLSSYKFVKTVNGNNVNYNAIIQDRNLNIQQIPSNKSKISVPLVGFNQYEVVEISFKVPYYKYGSFYTYEIELDDDEFLSDIQVFIKPSQTNVYDKYAVKQTKYFSGPVDKHVFFRWITFNKYAIDFGSGQFGINVSGMDCYIVYKKTKGASGNINVVTNASNIYVPQCSLIVYDASDNVITSTTLDFKKSAKVTIDSANGGESILDVDTFRQKVIEYIQTRDNLISRQDFYNVLNNHLNEFELLFKKTAVFENTFYLYKVFRDKYQTPIYTKTYTELKSNFTQLYQPVFTVNSKNFISPFYYKYNDVMNWYEAILLIDEVVVYFSKTSINNYTDLIPALYLKVVYDNVNNKTIYYLKSYQYISGRVFKITIPMLQVDRQDMTQVDDYTYSYEIDGISTDELTVYISEYNSDGTLEYYTVSTNKFYQGYDVSDILILQIYNDGVDDYVINIPLIDKDKFDSDKKYYYNLLYSYLVGLNLMENRMISDNIQTRFFETESVLQLYHQDILRQTYSFDISLPLKLNIQMKVDKNRIIQNKVDLSSERNDILNEVSSFLLNKCGSNIVIYNSHIIDVILKGREYYIKDVVVTIKDSNDNVIDSGLETKDLETFLKNFNGTKLDVVKFTPIYWWFDINNIEFNIQAED